MAAIAAPKVIVDATQGDYVIAQGEILKGLIKRQIIALQERYERVNIRIAESIPDPRGVTALLIALRIADHSVNENTAVIRSLVDTAAWLDNEIRELNTIGQTFDPSSTYRITVKDARRFGL